MRKRQSKQINSIILKEINAVLENISNAVNASRSSFFLLDQETSILESIVAQGLENICITVPLGQGIAGTVAHTGKSMIVNDAQNSVLLYKVTDNEHGFITRMVLCVPVFDESDKVLGVIQSINKKKGIFSKRDMIILESLAATISLIIKNTQLYETAKKGRENISTLLEVTNAISSELNLDSLIKLIMNKAAKITNADRATLFFLDDDHKHIWTKYAKGLEDIILKVPIGQGIAGMVAEQKTPYITNNAYENPFFDSRSDKITGYVTKSILGVPVLNPKQELIGVIQVINKLNGDFTEQDIWILNGFAAQTNIAIENAKLFHEIENMKNYLDSLIQHLNSGIMTVDSTGTIKTANSSLCQMLEVSSADFLGKHYKEIEEKYASIFHPTEKVINHGEKYEEFEIEAPIKQDKKLVFNLNAVPMHDNKGANMGAVYVLDDITQSKRIKNNLSRYFPKHLIKDVLNRDNLYLLDGKSQNCTILFSDIRAFTTLTEQLKAMEVVAMLNEYFQLMVDAVLDHNGVLDKFIGDAIMAVFGIPYANKLDPVNAVHTAIDMLKKLTQLNKKRFLLKKPPLKIGIGVSTGQVISGNIGAEKRFEYTVIGDPVNLASRLEGATKKYGVEMLICEATYKQIQDQFYCREIDTILVKGRKTPTKVYSVIDSKTAEISSKDEIFLYSYHQALSAYRDRSFTKAKEAFIAAQQLITDDLPTQIFIDRCNFFIDHPPTSDWDGVWELKDK